MAQKHIYIAGGCFWGTEHFFKQIQGVTLTEVGFANGHTDNPTYEQVYTDTTGYAETVHVVYDPEIVSLEFLLRMFFIAIDPTSLNKQGHDEGTRYRTGIYYSDPADLPTIEAVYADEQDKCATPFVVEKMPLVSFVPADEYHQSYLDKHPDGYCHLPKALFAFAKKANKGIGLCLMLFALLLGACSRHEVDETQVIRAMCEQINANYPAATLQDVYKTCYQDFFGAEHMALDTTMVYRYLAYELEQCAEQDLSLLPDREPTGFRHRYMRVNLSQVINGTMSADELAKRFIAAAEGHQVDTAQWLEEWQRIAAIAIEVQPQWRDSALQAELLFAAQHAYAVHHSDSYRNAYHPHYRIIPNSN